MLVRSVTGVSKDLLEVFVRSVTCFSEVYYRC